LREVRRLLIVGCGDVAKRAAPMLSRRFRLYGLSRRPDERATLRALGITPLSGDLDLGPTLGRLGFGADAVLHTAPPPAEGDDDPRTRRLLAALAKGRSLPRRLVYISTTGVYGDRAGAAVREGSPASPQTPRARRRVAAESRLRAWGARNGVVVTILRAPGIYAAERLPLERLRRGMPALRAEEDVVTNHVHAEDLARACVDALFRGGANRAYDVCDDEPMAMGEWFDLVADAFGLPRPARLTREQVRQRVSPAMLSFMGESRRLSNGRARRELRWRPRYPNARRGVAAAVEALRGLDDAAFAA
jgi:nucleoside-diphosphate-sugar epimerase